MFKTHRAKALFIALGLTAAGAAFALPADTGTVTINGTVTASSCTSAGATVTLPTVPVAAFNGSAGSNPTGSYTQPFSIVVACPQVGSTASVAFDTSSGVDSNNYLTNQASSGAATGVEVEVLDNSSNNAVGTSATAETATLSSGSGTLNYTAEYVETTHSVTPGAVQAVVGFTVSYN